jgi:hypothetical protein
VTDRLLNGGKVWPAITRAARSRPRSALVATPYFGRRGAALLPLDSGARLVINASEQAVKSGQTCPDALIRLQRRGVRLFSQSDLHATVYVFGTTAFVGSANASTSGLIEAVIQTSSRHTVATAREFVRSLCRSLVPLGEEQLRHLAELYREPRHRSTRRRAPGSRNKGPRTWLVHVWEDDVPELAEETYEQGWQAAERARSVRKHEVECFWHPYESPYQRNDTVVEVFHEHGGNTMIIPPGTVLRRQGWRREGRRLTFIYSERPPGRRISVDRLAKALGRGAKKRLLRQGPLGDNDFRANLLGYFDERR